MATPESQAPGTIKVVDRRRFTASGEVRADAPEDVAPPPPPPSAPEKTPAETAKKPQPSAAFMSFVASLATNALAAMGALPEAKARGLPVNIELAREYIDILAMLEDKTRGNLAREEESTLHRMVTELRMNYLELAKRVTRAPTPK